MIQLRGANSNAPRKSPYGGFIDFHGSLDYTLGQGEVKRGVVNLSIPDGTLKALIRDHHGLSLTDPELALVRPELDYHVAELERLRELDLSNLMSARLSQPAASVNQRGIPKPRGVQHDQWSR
jgi:hypothetical protein